MTNINTLNEGFERKYGVTEAKKVVNQYAVVMNGIQGAVNTKNMSRLNNIKNSIHSNSKLSDSQKKELLSKVDLAIDKLTSKEKQVEKPSEHKVVPVNKLAGLSHVADHYTIDLDTRQITNTKSGKSVRLNDEAGKKYYKFDTNYGSNTSISDGTILNAISRIG